MATKKLTDKFLKNLKPPKSGRLEYWDSIISDDRTLPGTFGIRITTNGAKSWVTMYRAFDTDKGKTVQRRDKVGNYPGMPLKEARRLARDDLLRVSNGEDPAAERRKAKASIIDGLTLTKAADDFVEKYAKRETRSWKETQRVFDRYIKPALGDFRVEAITPSQIRNLVEAMAEDTPYMANRTLATVRKFFNWAAERQIVSATPVIGIRAPGKETSRDRVLGDQELKDLWRAFHAIGWPFGDSFRLLLITGQRREEVGQMRWQHVDASANLWTLPSESTKAGRLHEVPLSGLALDILSEVPHTSKSYVFSTNGQTPISGFSRAKSKVDRLVAKHRLEASGKSSPTDSDLADAMIPNWRLHDLRRTVASNMAKQGTAPHVIEKVLNHSSGSISGVAAVYNRYAYTEEKRVALDQWARTLKDIVQV